MVEIVSLCLELEKLLHFACCCTGVPYATSADGLHWKKYPGNPVLAPDSRNEWEQNRVAAAQIIRLKGWYYAFYIKIRGLMKVGIATAGLTICISALGFARPIDR